MSTNLPDGEPGDGEKPRGTSAYSAAPPGRSSDNQNASEIDAADGRSVPSLKLSKITTAVAVAVVAGLLFIAILVLTALWYGGFPALAKEGSISIQTMFDVLKLAFAIVAGIGGVVGLVVAYRRQRVAEHSSQLAEFSHHLADAAERRAEYKKVIEDAAEARAKLEAVRNGTRLFNDRFGRASDQLGSDKAAVRLAGLYALTGLADDWLEGRQTCVDVLCAYLRLPYTPPALDDLSDHPTDGAGGHAAQEEREVRKTALRLIADHLRLPKESTNSWQGLDLDFTGATIDGGDFSGTNFSGGRVSFRRAKFVGDLTEFTRANFNGADVSFSGAEFRAKHVGFFEAKFSNKWVHFDRIRLEGALLNFAGAVLTNGAGLAFWESVLASGELRFASIILGNSSHISLSKATLSGAKVSFERARFQGGYLSLGESKIRGGSVVFVGAHLQSLNVSLTKALFDGGTVSFEGAEYGGTTASLWSGELPPGLVLPRGASTP